jgi:NitT/TauT family transport system ATP-binding protein
MKQRVAIARALCNKPRVLLMDEPFGALDAQTRSRMQIDLKDIWRNMDITIVFITHDLDEAVFMADRIVVLSQQGRILQSIEVPLEQPRMPDTHPDVQFDPRFIATRRLIDAMIHPKSAVVERLPIPRMTEPGDEIA